MTNRFKKICVYSNWGEWDYLDDRELKDGETLEIKFPDNTKDIYQILIIKTKEESYDHGKRFDLPIYKAHIECYLKGIKVLIPLVNLLARRVAK